MSLRTEVRTALARKDMTQAQLCELLGISQPTLIKVLYNGQGRLSAYEKITQWLVKESQEANAKEYAEKAL